MSTKQIKGAATYVGTQANRLAYFKTIPADGIEWYETDTDALVRVINGAWVTIKVAGTLTPVVTTNVVGVPSQETTIEAALASITDATDINRYTILVSPGTYTENNPLQLKSYVTITAVGDLGSVNVIAGNANQDLFTGVLNANMYGLELEGVTGANNWAINHAALGNMTLQNIVINECSNGILLNHAQGALSLSHIHAVSLSNPTGVVIKNANGNLTLDGLAVAANSTITTLVEADGAGTLTTIDVLNTFSTNLTTGLDFKNGAQGFVRNISIVGATIGVNAESGANIRLGNGGIFNCGTGLNIPDVGTNTVIGTDAISINSNTVNISIASATANLFGSMSTVWTNTSVVAAATVTLSVLDLFEGDEGLNILGELHVGTPERPTESVFGGGDSYTRGQLVYTYDGSSYVDVSEEAASVSGSSFTFPNTSINTAIYFASSLQRDGDFLKIPGFKATVVSGYTAAAQPLVIEYYDATAVGWVDVPYMVTESGGVYSPLARDIFASAGSFQVRFSAFLASEYDWGKNDDPGVGTDYFWIRIRIASAVTTVPVLEQTKLHSNRSELNNDGWYEMFGQARAIGRLPWDAGLLEPGASSPTDQDLYVSDNIDIGRVENLFANNATDRIGFLSAFPQDLDTSTSIRMRWSIRSTATGGLIDWVIRWAYTSPGSKVYTGAGDAPATGPNEQNITTSLAGPTAIDTETWYEVDMDVSDMLSRRVGGDPDTLWVTIERTNGDTHAGAVALISISANYLKWCVGGHY